MVRRDKPSIMKPPTTDKPSTTGQYKVSSEHQIESLLLKLARDPKLRMVAIEVEDKRATRVLQRHMNLECNDRIGGFVESTAKVSQESYVSCLSIIMDNVVVMDGAVVMGHRVIKGDQCIKRRSKDEDFWDNL
ncbi:MAG: hypothetical protein ACREBH_03540 [Candidatus Micrarchaeaceae archaeon]